MSIVLVGSTSGSITLQEPAVAGTTTLTLPATTGNVVVDSATQTLTNKTLTTPNINSAQFATVSGTAPIYPCRAWVNFNGTGTVSIRASGNVSSITDVTTGVYTINFTTAMPDANYSAVGSVFDNGVTCFATWATSSISVYTRLIQTGSFPTGSTADYSDVNVNIFR